jgi:hypothetical protein
MSQNQELSGRQINAIVVIISSISEIFWGQGSQIQGNKKLFSSARIHDDRREFLIQVRGYNLLNTAYWVLGFLGSVADFGTLIYDPRLGSIGAQVLP